MNANCGKNCPACMKDIGLWPIVRAGWPTRIKCPNCKSILRYNTKTWKSVTFGFLEAGTLLIISIILVCYFFGTSVMFPFPRIFLLYFILCGLYEIITAVYLRGHKDLLIVKDRFKKSDIGDT